MPRTTIIASSLLLALWPAGSPAGAAEQIVQACEDSWIHGLSSSTNAGSDDRLSICPTADYWIYLKFDLGGIEEEVDAAELRLTRFDGSRPEEISLYFISDDSWSEATITGPSRPEPRDPTNESTLGRGEDAGDLDRWSSDALTALVRDESRDDGVLTLMLREDPDDRLDVRRFFSREGARNDSEVPQLVLAIAAEEERDPGWSVADVGSGTKPSFDFGPGDSVHVMGMTEEFNGVVWYAVRDDTSGPFEQRTVATGYFYGPGDLRVAEDGSVHVAWHNHEAEDPDHARVDTEGELTRFTVSTPGNHNGWDNALALDGQGRLHMSSVDPVSFGAATGLEYSVFNGSAWEYEKVPGSGAFMYGLATAIAVDREDRPHIVYCMADDWTSPGELRYAVRQGDWEVSTVVSEGIPGRFPALALDHWDRPHSAWLDIVPGDPDTAEVKYGVLNNGAWEIETVDTLENVRLGFSDARKSVSLALDGNYRPHLAYGDQREVKYAVKSFESWEITTVLRRADDAYKGLVVLRLDSRDLPAIVFWQTVQEGSGLIRLASRKKPERPLFHRGDPDASGSTDITDAIYLFSWLFLGESAPPCIEAADADNDGNLNLTDGVIVLGYLFTGGRPPAAPRPDEACGTDSDPPGSRADLGCKKYSPCAGN